MSVPIHIEDQRAAARQDALKLALIQSGAKLLVMFAVYEDTSAVGIAGVNIDLCTDVQEARVGSTIGRALGERLAAMYNYLEQEAGIAGVNGEDPPVDGPAGWVRERLDRLDWTKISPPREDADQLADAIEAVVRSCHRSGLLSLRADLTLDDLVPNIRSLAALAVMPSWREQQRANPPANPPRR